MNYLELCQELAREAGISGAIPSVIGQAGEALRVVNWIAKAHVFIQNEHSDWTFLRRDISFDTTASNTYTAAAAGVAEFGEWLFGQDARKAWRCYAPAIGVADEQPVRYMPYDRFRQVYGYGSNRLSTGRPLVVTQKPDQSLLFWPTPTGDAPYTIVGEQYRAPQRLAANADIPLFPARFHDVIVYRALMLYAEFEGDQSVFAVGQTECKRILAKMEELYLPEWEDAEPMA